MSPSVDLQTIIYQTLLADPGVSAIVADRVFDNVPAEVDYPYISFGPSDYLPNDADCILGRIESFQVDCWTDESGKKRPARLLSDAIKRALHENEPDLEGHALVRMRVTGVRILDDPSKIIAHGVVTVEATIEES